MADVSTRRSRGGSYAVGRARKARIIEIAADEFARGGFYNTPLTRIAEAAALTDAGLSYHFASKQHLLLAVVELRHRETRQWWAQFEDADARSFLNAFPRAAERDLSRPGLIELFVTLAAEAARPDHPAHAFFVERYRDTIAGVTRGLRYGVATDRLRTDLDVPQTAAEIVAVCDGLQLQWMLSGRATDLVGRVHAYTDRLARTITIDGSGLDRLPEHATA